MFHTSTRRLSLIPLCVACLGCSRAVAQTSLSGQIELARLIDLAAQRLHVRITYDEQSLKSKLTARQFDALTDTELWQFANRALLEQGLTTVRPGEDASLSVVKLPQAAQAARLEAWSLPGPEGGQQPGFRRVLVRVRTSSTKELVAAVQLVLSKPGGLVAESEQAGMLVVADLTPNLTWALGIIEQLDGSAGGATVQHISPRHLDAAQLATQAKLVADKCRAAGGRELRGELVPTAGSTALLLVAPPNSVPAWLELIDQLDQREPVERRIYQPGSFGAKEVANLIEQAVHTGPPGQSMPSDDRWRLIQDDLTGSLLITATASQHGQIADLLQRLAAVPAAARQPARTFLVRNRAVRDIQQLIENLLRAGALDAALNPDPGAISLQPGGTSQTSIRAAFSDPLPNAASPASSQAIPPQPAPAGVQPRGPAAAPSRFATASAPLSLTSDEATNTLIAVGEPRILAQLEQLLPALDVRQPQVMLEAFLVSLTDNQTLDLGVELEKLRVSGDTFIRLSSLFGLSSASGTGASRTRSSGDSTGFSGVVLDPGDFSVVVRALESLNKGRSLSRPKLLVTNNQQATFNSVLQQPFSSTNASNTVSTTSFGGTQDAGTTISVKPQIAQGDHLSLTYSVALSSFIGAAANPNLPPPRQQNTVQSMATIPDGYTVVVGGLEITSDGNNTSQVPILGDIPGVGELFKNRSVAHTRTRFYVFIRASVLRSTSFEDLKYLSDASMSQAGVDPGWPSVEPRLIGAAPNGVGRAPLEASAGTDRASSSKDSTPTAAAQRER